MKCNTLRFVVRYQNATELDPLEQLFTTLRRRGAFFSHIYSLYKYGNHATGYRMNIPAQFPSEPFVATLKESGLIHGIDKNLVELDVVPIYDE